MSWTANEIRKIDEKPETQKKNTYLILSQVGVEVQFHIDRQSPVIIRQSWVKITFRNFNF